MRPVTLVMQAFGPYREPEVVDFAELGTNRVFLIHGDTGAGKTTILDAMVFALYGETSGGERQADQMRSDQAAPGLPTEVVFDFSLGERRFRIKRRPAQELQGVRGAALVSKPAEVVLWERTGCAAAEEGRPLSTKIREVETQIKDLLGFSCEQFRQVVVLPQGRFRELLSSGSDKREEILRQLFRTERFRELEVLLGERAKSVRSRMEQLKLRREAQLGLAAAADDAELAARVAEAGLELEAAAEAVNKSGMAAARTSEALAAAEAGDQARQAVREARAEVETFEQRGEEMAAADRRLKTGGRADKVQPAANRHSEAGMRLSEARVALATCEQGLLQARNAEQAAAVALAAEQERLVERRAASDRVRYLEGLAGVIEAWRSAKGEYDEATGRAQSAQVAHDEATQALTKAREALAARETDLVAGKADAAQAETARGRLEGAKQSAERCRRLLGARTAVVEAERRQADLATVETVALNRHRESQAELADIEARWKSGRAAALAAALKTGEPCPVCGSTEHPAPAAVTAADVSDDALEARRSAAASAREVYDQAHEASGGSGIVLSTARAREHAILQEPGMSADLSLADAERSVAAVLAELEQLAGRADVSSLEVEIAGAKSAVAETVDAAQVAADNLAIAEKTLAGAEARLNERAAGIPEDLRAPGALEHALERWRENSRGLEAAFVDAQEQAAATEKDRIALAAAAESAVAGQSKAAEHERSCQEDYLAALREHGFSDVDEWRRCLVPESERITLQQSLETYRDALHQAKGRLQQAELALEGQPEPGDIAEVRAAAEQARLGERLAISRHADAKNLIGKLEGIKERLTEIDNTSDDARRTYETVGVLAEVAGGQNPSRVSFQRWVLGVYLDEVLLAASRKLYAMSKGRYQLERLREVASRGRASGLDLAVFDEFSGTSRPAVTLSGGESFLAALALALGLAETVQEHSAGVPLETIFVDEGFGALDADALELAVDALMELQMSGRLVGVISHVPELKLVIPARLEVRGGPGGSSARFFVP